jgi:hypothetical protein
LKQKREVSELNVGKYFNVDLLSTISYGYATEKALQAPSRFEIMQFAQSRVAPTLQEWGHTPAMPFANLGEKGAVGNVSEISHPFAYFP